MYPEIIVTLSDLVQVKIDGKREYKKAWMQYHYLKYFYEAVARKLAEHNIIRIYPRTIKDGIREQEAIAKTYLFKNVVIDNREDKKIAYVHLATYETFGVLDMKNGTPFYWPKENTWERMKIHLVPPPLVSAWKHPDLAEEMVVASNRFVDDWHNNKHLWATLNTALRGREYEELRVKQLQHQNLTGEDRL